MIPETFGNAWDAHQQLILHFRLSALHLGDYFGSAKLALPIRQHLLPRPFCQQLQPWPYHQQLLLLAHPTSLCHLSYPSVAVAVPVLPAAAASASIPADASVPSRLLLQPKLSHQLFSWMVLLPKSMLHEK